MRLVLVTQDAPIYLAGFLDEAITRLQSAGHQVIGVVATSATFKKSAAQEAKARLALYGPAAFTRMAIYIVWNKLMSKLAARWRGIGCYSLANVLARHGLQRLELPSVRSADLTDLIRNQEVDLVISVASSEIFKRRLLEAPRLGCINYHTGLLPKYRGRQPLFWALYHGESEVGISIHEMDEKLDNGPILVQARLPVGPRESLHSLYQRTIAAGPALLAEAVDKLATGVPDRLANDPAEATTHSFPKAADGRRFRASGGRFF